MTEPDEALIWAREDTLKIVKSEEWPAVRNGDFDHQYWGIETKARAYRAGQAASAARIKALEEGLMKAIRLIPGAFIPGDEEHYKVLKILADATGREVVVLPHKETDRD